MIDPIDHMDREEVEGWTVVWSAPTLGILDHLGRVVFWSEEWDPNMSDPREDALSWASAVADPGSGLTVDYDDDPAFGASVRRVRELCPPLFADECASLAMADEDDVWPEMTE